MDHTTVAATDSTLTLIGLLLAALALALAWTLYRLGRVAERHRELDAVTGVLKGVRRGMVDVAAGDVGWGAHYFTTIYTTALDDQEVNDRANAAAMAVSEYRTFSEVWPVPTAPLEEVIRAAARGEGLISEETVFTANVGLWRVGVFNHLVRLQSDFNARHLAEIKDAELAEPRRMVLAEVASTLSRMLHQHGVGEANVPGGWYYRFSAALEADINRLSERRRQGVLDYSSQRWLALGDVASLLLVAAFVALVVAQTV